MPKMEKVYLHNPSSEQISLISISATTAHFHASFFQNRVSTNYFYLLCFLVTLYLLLKSKLRFHGSPSSVQVFFLKLNSLNYKRVMFMEKSFCVVKVWLH